MYDKRNIENVKDIVVPAERVLKPRRVVRVGVGESIMVAVYYDYGVFIQSAFFKPLDKLSDSAVGVVYRLNIASEESSVVAFLYRDVPVLERNSVGVVGRNRYHKGIKRLFVCLYLLKRLAEHFFVGKSHGKHISLFKILERGEVVKALLNISLSTVPERAFVSMESVRSGVSAVFEQERKSVEVVVLVFYISGFGFGCEKGIYLSDVSAVRARTEFSSD